MEPVPPASLIRNTPGIGILIFFNFQKKKKKIHEGRAGKSEGGN